MDETTPAVYTAPPEVLAEVGTPDIYVGSSKVNPITLPNGLISFQFENLTLLATKEQFESMKSDKPYEDGLISIKKWKPTVAKILAILTQDNLTMNDKDFVIQRIDMSILENYHSATEKLFGVSERGDVSMQQIIDIVSPKV